MPRIEASEFSPPADVPLETPASRGPQPPPLQQIEFGDDAAEVFVVAPPQATRTAADTLPQLSSLLGRSPTDPFVTAEDTNRALQLLEEVKPKEFRDLLIKFETNGSLETFLANAPPETRDGLLDLYRRRGLVKTEGGGHTEAAFSPPPAPVTFRDDRRLPEVLREAISAHQGEAWARYDQDYGAYLDRYGDAVQRTQSPAELRKLGPPADPASTSVRHLSNVRAHLEVSNKVKELRHQAPAGSAAVGGSVEAQLLAFKRTSEVTLDRSGVTTRKSQGLEVNAGLFTVEAGTGGQSLKVNTPLGVEVDSKGNVTFEVEEGPVTSKVGVSADGATVKVAVCVAAVEVEDFAKLELCAQLELQGLSPQAAREAADRSTGFFEPPRELREGRAWTSLSAQRRASLEYRGWTEAEWSSTVGGQGRKDRLR